MLESERPYPQPSKSPGGPGASASSSKSRFAHKPLPQGTLLRTVAAVTTMVTLERPDVSVFTSCICLYLVKVSCLVTFPEDKGQTGEI